METTDLIEVALRFVSSTNSHVFLTGKAGTGKTTLLHRLAATTHKRHVIIAPTGIAALNAKGVTIHSQFLLPLGTFIPERDAPSDLSYTGGYYTQRSLATKHPLNAVRRKVLRALDLIIIDEVSMLRADVLDAIDYRMRSVKGNFRQSFGGVQVLMIGDLYQLPPIVKDDERAAMARYYRSPHFFEAKALQQDGFVFIELDRIFRQKDDKFILLLNHLRNNIITAEDVKELNAHHVPEADAYADETITVTTHNYRADELNSKALERLPGRSHFFDAKVEGDFPESAYPVPARIELKSGTQVMFVKNDTQEGVYFNGKLATVIDVDDEGVTVKLAGSNTRYTLRKETWENKRYSTDASSGELKEDVIGTYIQFPIRLAWAITVHKSQGLTFEKAVIDVGRAFAPGQVYVALSRLTSLDGLILRTPISPDVVSTDAEVVEFSKRKETQGELGPILQEKQAEFLHALLSETYDFSELLTELDRIRQKHSLADEFEDAEMRAFLPGFKQFISDEVENTLRFKNQLAQLLAKRDDVRLVERLAKGSTYYEEKITSWIQKLLQHLAEVALLSKTKSYQDALEELDTLLMRKWEQVQKAEQLANSVLHDSEVSFDEALQRKRAEKRAAMIAEVRRLVAEKPKNSSRKTGRLRKVKDATSASKPKAVKGQTYVETYALLNEGLSIAQVAAKRGLSLTTIEGHAAKGIGEGSLRLEMFLNSEQITEISAALAGRPLKDAYEQLAGRYGFGQLRMVEAAQKKE
jgi:uncharacterized protein YpbB